MIHIPVFNLRYQIKIAPDEGILLFIKEASFFLRGKIYVAIANLINGRRRLEEIAQILSTEYDSSHVYDTLIQLEHKKYLVEINNQLWPKPILCSAVTSPAMLREKIIEFKTKNNSFYSAARLLTRIFFPPNFSANEIIFLGENHFISAWHLLTIKKTYQSIAVKDDLTLLLDALSAGITSQKQNSSFIQRFAKIPLAYQNNLIGLEIHLCESKPIDFSFYFPSTEIQFNDKKTFSSHYMQELIAACKEINKKKIWVNPTWIEFDADSSTLDVMPAVFLQFNTALSKKCDAFMEIVKNKLPLRENDFFIPIFEKCLAHLPATASISNIGHMYSRSTFHYKIVILPFPNNEIISYLHAIHWQNENVLLLQIIRELCSYPFKIGLSLDVKENLQNRLGIEVNCKHENDLRKLLSILVKYKICSKSKSMALNHYGFLQWDKEFNFNCSFINHIKLTFDETSVSAKAYIKYYSSAVLLKDCRVMDVISTLL